MISEIEGVLVGIEESKAQVRMSQGVTYEVLLSAYSSARLGTKIDEVVRLHTYHFLEGNSQGSSFIPRLAGFMTVNDKAFFEIFTTVKGIGAKKALRALAMSTGQLASAITDRDVKLLQTLPEIGKRTAETIVATLHGKVDRFVGDAVVQGGGSGDDGGEGGGGEGLGERSMAARNALEILIQLGENRKQALIWVDEVLMKEPDLTDPQEIITQVFNLKASV